MTNITIELATLVQEHGAEQALEQTRLGLAEAQERRRITKFRIRGLGTAYCVEHRPELIERRDQEAREIERLAVLIRRLEGYNARDRNITHADTGLECGNCAATLCLEEAIEGCFNCNHSILDTACRNYGDGHCKCCGKCKGA